MFNDINNLETDIYKNLKEIYINSSKSKYHIPLNTRVEVSSALKSFLGISCKNVRIIDILKAYSSTFPTDEKEVVLLLFDKYGEIETKNDVKNNKKLIIDTFINSLSDKYDDNYIEFLIYKFGNSKLKIYNNKDDIDMFYRAFKRPIKYTMISEFALKTINNPHGFDKGTKMRGWLDSLLSYLYDDVSLENHNIYQDYAAISVLSKNVVILKENIENCILSFTDIDNVDVTYDSDIYIMENSNALQMINQVKKEIKLVSSDGFPNRAFKLFILKLIENNNRLYYSGDLDYNGLKIADNLLLDFPNIKLLDMNKDTYMKYISSGVPSPKKQYSFDLINEDLKEVKGMIDKCDKVIYQEIIIQGKLFEDE